MDTQVPAPMTPRQEELYRTLPGRYRKVLADVAAGFTDGEIADRWHMSEATITAEQFDQRITELIEMYRAGTLDDNHIPELMDTITDLRAQSESRLALIALQSMRINALVAELERLAACEPAHKRRILAVLNGGAG